MPGAGYIRIGKVSEFPSGSCRVIDVGGRAIAVRRVDDKFYAFRNSCPHHGAPLSYGVVAGTMLPSRPGELDYGMEDLVLRCPWHGYEFSLQDGAMLFGTGTRRIVMYSLTAEDGELYLNPKGR
jgi:nitrite reductase (NADH) small subunit